MNREVGSEFRPRKDWTMKQKSFVFAVTVVGLLSLIAADYAWAKG
jgi:hypothetical protein